MTMTWKYGEGDTFVRRGTKAYFDRLTIVSSEGGTYSVRGERAGDADVYHGWYTDAILDQSYDPERGLSPHQYGPMPTGEVTITDPDTGGMKGQKPARFDLLPWNALREIAEHYGKGAEKYEDRNWERGYDWSLSFAALQRHLTAWWQGEDIDAETGSSHLAAVAFHVLALMTFKETHPEKDNRPK
jgi:hypothetical protein